MSTAAAEGDQAAEAAALEAWLEARPDVDAHAFALEVQAYLVDRRQRGEEAAAAAAAMTTVGDDGNGGGVVADGSA